MVKRYAAILSVVGACLEISAFQSASIRSWHGVKIHANADGLGPPIEINKNFDGLKLVHSDPDVYVIERFLDEKSCSDMVERAKGSMQLSPVAYAGWTKDVSELLELAAKGPVSWLAIGSAWLQTKDDSSANIFDLIKHISINYLVCYTFAAAAIVAFVKSRENSLQSMRTSTSTTLDSLDDPHSGTAKFVRRSAELFTSSREQENPQREASFFEAPTVIHYDAEQLLAPHYDANRSADMEDKNRGGQTLATLLVYLNDVDKGGLTKFGKLPAHPNQSYGSCLAITPRKGDALLFFPADRDGTFDERLEHEGAPAVDEKWIARIWRHKERGPSTILSFHSVVLSLWL
jgi:hypothetical protein